MKNLIWTLAAIFVALATGCSKNDDPDNGGYIKPDQVVADPTGTIELSMRNANNGKTWLGNIYIGADDNFTGSNCYIASVGPVKGLGNVSSIPTAGWAREVAVTPGNGYVVYDASNDEFYRVYVIDYITSTSGGVIGADVKYQKPFKGLDETIRVKEDKVVLPAEGGSQQIVFENTSIIPFKVSSSEGWCKVRKASTRDQSFLYDAIVISCDESFAAKDEKANVTIENLYGNKKTIEVTRAAKGEFITLSQENVQVNFSTSSSTNTVNVFTNIEPSDIKISSSADWLTAIFSGSSTQKRIKWIENEPVTRATLDNPVSRALQIKTDGYGGATARKGSITLTSGKAKATLEVTQSGSEFSIDKTEFKFEAGKNLSTTSNWSGNISSSKLVAEPVDKESSWVTIKFNSNYLNISAQANPSTKERIAKIKIGTNEAGKFIEMEEIKVIQEGVSVSLKQSEITFNTDSDLTQTINYTANVNYSDIKVAVDNENSQWVKVSINQKDITVTLQPNPFPETRSASINLTYNDIVVSKLNVKQKGAVLTDKYLYFTSASSNYTLSFPIKEGYKITSSANWCSATPNGASLLIRVSATTEDRSAIITVEGVDAKVYVSQSKYQVGATYKVGNINATVYSMEGGVGKIVHRLYERKWSTEYIDIQGLTEDDGSKNMDVIKAIPGWEALYPAFEVVDALNKDGITGWYLPAKNEYSESYRGYDDLGHSTTLGYWTSTQANSGEAYTTYNGSKASKQKYRMVVAMKQFSYDFSKK